MREPARIALLIGNQKYSDAVGALRNPHHDVALVADALRRLRFRVTVVRDGSHRQMDIAIKEHIAAVRRAGAGAISFFYYSGHGAADPETQINYVIPVDVASAANRSLWTRSIEQNDITDKLNRQAPAATHYVVFDACRNELKLPGEGRSLGAEKGFVPVPQTAGLLIAYSTAPKQTASDAGDDGGTYAKALAEEIVIPGQEAVGMFRNVQIRVKQAIGQDPWLSFPSLPTVYLAGQLGPGETSEAARAWEQARASGSIQTLEALAAQFPGSVYAGLAKDRVAMLRKQKADEEKRAAEAALKEKAGLARLAGRWMIETRWAAPCANPLGRLVVDIRADGTLQSFLPAVDTSAASDQRNDRVYDVNVGADGSFRLGYRVEKSGERPWANILSGNLARGEGTGRSMRDGALICSGTFKAVRMPVLQAGAPMSAAPAVGTAPARTNSWQARQ